MLFKCLNWNNVVKLDSYKQAHRLTNKRHQEKNKVIKLTTKVKHYIGDWEVDLVIGKGHKGGFATPAERKSRLYLVLPIANKTACSANDAIIKLLMPLKRWVKILTFDNGREFSWHTKLAEKLECSTYGLNSLLSQIYKTWFFNKGQDRLLNNQGLDRF